MGFGSGLSTIKMFFCQLHENCREQRQPLYIAVIDATKAFDLVRSDSLFKILDRIGCPPRLLSIVQSFHADIKGVVLFGDTSSRAFNIPGSLKLGCALARNSFGIFLPLILKRSFGVSNQNRWRLPTHKNRRNSVPFTSVEVEIESP